MQVGHNKPSTKVHVPGAREQIQASPAPWSPRGQSQRHEARSPAARVCPHTPPFSAQKHRFLLLPEQAKELGGWTKWGFHPTVAGGLALPQMAHASPPWSQPHFSHTRPCLLTQAPSPP